MLSARASRDLPCDIDSPGVFLLLIGLAVFFVSYDVRLLLSPAGRHKVARPPSNALKAAFARLIMLL
jgi:hypothetical protein